MGAERMPDGGRAAEPGDDAWGTSRRSRLFGGPFLVHADLHNHSWFSDGAGDPARAFPSLRAAGLDVAALTDHSRWSGVFLGLVKAPGPAGIDRRDWARAGELADRADRPGEFVALRGFEWSHGLHGHMNVWGSRDWTEPLRTFGPAMGTFWRWLERREGLVSFNHPGTGGRLRFGHFGYRPAMAPRLVGLEMFNKTNDYLFQDTDRGGLSPLVECLDAGWRPGLLGVTDEHGADWGRPDGKGRAGLYVHELTRAGVLEALAARRVFASRVKGLRLDAAVDGVRMGGELRLDGARPVRVELDLDRGPAWRGRPLHVQVLRPGRPLPALAATVELRMPPPGGPPAAFELRLDPAAGPWMVLRVCDPAGPPDPRARAPLADAGRAIAYASPFWLRAP